MHYKTIVLELLQAHPALYRWLCLSRTALRELDRYSADLRANHLELSRSLPPDAAMELAVAEIQERIAQEAARVEA